MILMDKAALRTKFIKLREKLSPPDLSSKSSLIAKNLFSRKEFTSANVVAIYFPIKNEVSTQKIIDFLFEHKKRVVVPVVNGNNLVFSEYNKSAVLAEGSFGVFEPVEKIIVPAGQIDFFIVPGIAFDSACFRLGWGKGFYDKFLSKPIVMGLKAGLAFDFQVVDSVPHDSFDVQLDFVVSEKTVYRKQ